MVWVWLFAIPASPTQGSCHACKHLGVYLEMYVCSPFEKVEYILDEFTHGAIIILEAQSKHLVEIWL